MSMKVLVSDNLGQIGIDMFEQAEGIQVDVKTGLAPDELKSIIGDYDALVIRSAGPPDTWLKVLAAIVLGPPQAWGGYTFLRDAELEGYQ